MASPAGMLVPRGGSSCGNCLYVAPSGQRCLSRDYIAAQYKGKVAGDSRFIDGKTGCVVVNPYAFCCNWFDWPAPGRPC